MCAENGLNERIFRTWGCGGVNGHTGKVQFDVVLFWFWSGGVGIQGFIMLIFTRRQPFGLVFPMCRQYLGEVPLVFYYAHVLPLRIDF